MNEFDKKKFKKDNIGLYGSILYKVTLSQRWTMLITNHGERFYFDNIERKSVWQMPQNEEAYKIIYDNQQLLISWIGMIRGAYISSELLRKIGDKFGLTIKKRDDNKDKVKEIQQEDQKFKEIEIQNEEDNDDDKEFVDEIEDDNEDDNEEENQFALDLSDLDDLISESEDEKDKLNQISDVNEKIISSDDPLLSEYLNKYTKLSNIISLEEFSSSIPMGSVIGFLKLLEDSNIDAYSSYDLEIDDLVGKPEYTLLKCQLITPKIQRELWDEYCRIRGIIGDNEITENKEKNSKKEFFKNDDTLEIQFAVFLKTNGLEKLPKFYTDFNRQILRKAKIEHDDEYPELCKQIPLNVRQLLYNKWRDFSKLETDDDREKIIFDSLKKVSGSDNMSEIINTIKQKKLVDSFDCFFFDNEQLQQLETRL
ncbi:hypothetical protein C6P42_004296 [Pichia californica]|nr:hypothetical protein C6P42_004296 [[Candida] californica]